MPPRRAVAMTLPCRLAAALLAGVLLAGCGGEDPEPSGPLPDIAKPSLPAVAPSVMQVGVPQIVAISLKNGVVTGDAGPVPLKVNTQVRLTVLSDVTDILLVQGYQRRAQVTVGSPVQLQFIADRVGTFDVVLQASGQRLTELVVS